MFSPVFDGGRLWNTAAITELLPVLAYHQPADKSEAAALCMLRYDDVIAAAGTANDCQNPGAVLYRDADMLAGGVEYQIAGLAVLPGNRAAIAVLVGRAAAVPGDVSAIVGAVESAAHKPTAIHSEGTHRSGGRAVVSRDLHGRSPAAVPAEDEGLTVPEAFNL